jgi:hypothetical protein
MWASHVLPRLVLRAGPQLPSMIDPDADPDQLDLEDMLPSRQASFVFWRPGSSPSEAAPASVLLDEDPNQLTLPLLVGSKRYDEDI